MTHKPKNPFCEACVRAKKAESPSYKGAYVKTAEEWGHKLTADHITSLKDNMLGITGDKDALTIKDEYSGLKNLYPTKTKNAEETQMAIREFAGDRIIHNLYSDKSGEIAKALRDLNIMPKNSVPGRPQTNAVIERANRDILEGIRTSLVRAGLPACFWTFACFHYCLADNIAHGPDGSSPWLKTHGYPFTGELVPFGAAVIYKPTPVQDVAISKMEPSTRVGIFAGYKIEPGYKWGSEKQTGKYLVWDLDAFS